MAVCSGTFNSHTHGKPQLQFMSMFDNSFGLIEVKDTDLLSNFSAAYGALKNDKEPSSSDLDRRIKFVDTLQDLTLETDLLTEVKDIRDELHIMNTILIDQQRVARSLRGL